MEPIRRQTSGPGDVGRQVRQVNVTIEALPGGGYRLSTPAARGWAMVARNQHELVRGIRDAFTEAQCAAYARWRGERYELDRLTDPVDGDPMAPPRRPQRRTLNGAPVGWGRNQERPDVHDVSEWVRLPDGSLQSPSGMTYRPDTLVARRVLARAHRLGVVI